MFTKQLKGQSIIEYIILVATVIIALMFFLGRDGIFEQSYNSVLEGQGDDVLNMSQQIFN